MSTSLVLGVIGGVIGGIVSYGNPYVIAQGFAIGAAIGGAVDPPTGPDQMGPRLQDLTVQNSSYGAFIPIVYGSYRLSGNVVWSEDIRETKHEEEVGGKGGGGATSTTFTYSCSFAVSICEGGDDENSVTVRRIFADGKLVYDAATFYLTPPETETVTLFGKFGTMDIIRPAQTNGFSVTGIAFYGGGEEQMPDPSMEAAMGVGNVPAYRGQAYVVFTDMQLANYGNRIPNLSFEVVKNGTYTDSTTIDEFEYGSTMGYTSIYNPVRNELWEFDSFLPGVVRRDALSGDILGTISTSSYASAIETQYFAAPIYDPIKGYIYVGSSGARKVIQFDAANATVVQAITWSSGATDWFGTSPTTGELFRTAIVSGAVRLQSKDPVTLVDNVNVAITAQFSSSPRFIFDGDSTLWLFDSDSLRQYSIAGVLLFTYTDVGWIGDVVYDKDRDSLWFTADLFTSSYATTRTVTGVTLGTQTVVTFAAGSGPGFYADQSIRITDTLLGPTALFNGPTGDEHTCVSATATTVTIDFDSTGMPAYVSGGSIKSDRSVIREYSLISRSIVRTVLTGASLGNLSPALLYDTTRRVVWAINDNNFTNLTAVSTDDGSILRRISVSPYYHVDWTNMANSDIWYIDDSEDVIRRIRISSTLNADGTNLAYVVHDICTRSSLTSEEIDVTQLEDTPVRGYAITSAMSGRAAIESLMNGYFFDSVDSDGTVKFPLRGGNPATTIPSSNMVDTE